MTTCQNKHARVFCVCDVTDRRTFFSESSFEMPVLNTKHQTTLIYCCLLLVVACCCVVVASVRLLLLPSESFCTCYVCANHTHTLFCPQHWLLCHMGLYLLQAFKLSSTKVAFFGISSWRAFGGTYALAYLDTYIPGTGV